MTRLEMLARDVERGSVGQFRNLDSEFGHGNGIHAKRAYDGSLDAAKLLHNAVIPGWSWRVARCCVSDDAWVSPDFNCPINGARLKETVPMLLGHREWHNLTDVDLRPAGNPARAWLLSIIIAMGALGK